MFLQEKLTSSILIYSNLYSKYVWFYFTNVCNFVDFVLLLNGFVLQDKSQKLTIKSKILHKCKIPLLLYGDQTWTLQIAQILIDRKIFKLQFKTTRGMLISGREH